MDFSRFDKIPREIKHRHELTHSSTHTRSSCNLTHAVDIMEANSLPNNGTASDVAGIVSATMFKNTVNDSKIVTPVRCTRVDIFVFCFATMNNFVFNASFQSREEK